MDCLAWLVLAGLAWLALGKHGPPMPLSKLVVKIFQPKQNIETSKAKLDQPNKARSSQASQTKLSPAKTDKINQAMKSKAKPAKPSK